MDVQNREGLIKEYFRNGYEYKEILLLLKENHGLDVKLRTLERILQRNNLGRKKLNIDNRQIVRAVHQEVTESGGCFGYRKVHQRLLRKGIQVDRETVRLTLKEIDPAGVNKRKRNRLKRRQYINNGPYYLWHLDGNDKLLPFGFGIHGLIDGYSKKILWLNVSSSNKNPKLIQTVKNLNFKTARIIRADRGTENGIVAGIQRFFA